jgi:hypothetical protein
VATAEVVALEVTPNALDLPIAAAEVASAYSGETLTLDIAGRIIRRLKKPLSCSTLVTAAVSSNSSSISQLSLFLLPVRSMSASAATSAMPLSLS